MKITHLVTNGCSWTYGQGLDNIREQAWPALLANKLGCEVVNLAIPGTGNESITRRNYEYVYESLNYKSNPLFVIMFSQIWRKEVWMHDYYGTPANGYVTMFPAHETDGNPTEKAWLREFNEEDFLRRNMLMKFATKNLLDSYKFPYVITQFQGDGVKPEYIQKVKERFPVWYNEYEKMNDYPEISKAVKMLDKTHCTHPGPLAQQVIADLMFTTVQKKYGLIEFDQRPFLRLKDFSFLGKNNIVNANATHWF